MAGEIQMDVVLNPQMDKNAVQALFQTQDRLAARLLKAHRGSQLRLRTELATLAAGATKLGLADTPRAYMMQFLSLTNQGQYSSFQKALGRSAGQQGAAILKAEKSAAQQQVQAQRAQDRANKEAFAAAQKAEQTARREETAQQKEQARQEAAQQKEQARQEAAQQKEQARQEAAHRKELVAAAKQTELERAYDTKQFVEARYRREEGAGVLRRYKSLRAEHMRLVSEGGTKEQWAQHKAETVKLDARMTRMISNMEKNGKTATTWQKMTAQSTKRLAAESAAGGKIISSPLSGLGQLGALGLRALGIGSLVGAIGAATKFMIRQVQASVDRGKDIFGYDAAYGGSVSHGAARARSALYGISEQASYGAQTYAADFRQRMLYGEVSDKEWIALSQMGEYGRFIMSGRGEDDPETAERLLDEYLASVRGNRRAESRARWQLKTLGMTPEEIMKRGTGYRTSAEVDQATTAYQQISQADLLNALAAIDVWQQINEQLEKLGSGKGAYAKAVAGLSPQARDDILRYMSGSSLWDPNVVRYEGTYGAFAHTPMSVKTARAIGEMWDFNKSPDANKKAVMEGLGPLMSPTIQTAPSIHYEINNPTYVGDGARELETVVDSANQKALEQMSADLSRMGVDGTTYGQSSINTAYGRK